MKSIIGNLYRIIAVILLAFTLLFYNLPAIWQNPRIPPEIKNALAASLATPVYLSNSASGIITSTTSWQIKTSAPSSSNTTTSVKQAKNTNYFQWQPGVSSNTTNSSSAPTSPNGKGFIYDTTLDSTIPTGTWTFNVKTTASSATGTGHVVVCAWKVTASGGAITGNSTIFPSSAACVEGSTNIMTTTSPLASSVSLTNVAATSFTSSQYLYVEYWLRVTGAGSSSTATTKLETNAGSADDIALPGSSSDLAPNAPSQNNPANAATGISTSPTFLMTATDPESDNLSYKVTIYSNSSCTTLVQTNDQSVSSSGWTGTNASCTNNPTSCYSSGTQGSFQTQTALSANTQYWWKASAKDPDGNGNFTDSSTCNTFTTGIISISVANGTVSYGFVAPGASKDTTAAGLSDTQTITNNGTLSEDFNIKGQNSANWTLGTAAGTDTYVHQFSTNSGSSWSALTINYQTLGSNIAVNGTQNLDLKLTAPTSSSSLNQQSVDVTIQAVAH